VVSIRAERPSNWLPCGRAGSTCSPVRGDRRRGRSRSNGSTGLGPSRPPLRSALSVEVEGSCCRIQQCSPFESTGGIRLLLGLFPVKAATAESGSGTFLGRDLANAMSEWCAVAQPRCAG